MERIASPLPIEYDGWDAVDHRLDAHQMGASMQGLSRLYRTTFHFYLTGQLSSRLRTADVRILAGSPKEGSVSYLLWVMLAHGRLAVYPELLAEFADLCVPEIIKAMFAKRSKQNEAYEKAVDTIYDLAKDNVALANRMMDFSETVHKAQMLDKKRLHTTINRLTQHNGGAMIASVAPVGSSAKSLVHAKGTPAQLVIDEPGADIIRAHGNLEVAEAVDLLAIVTAIDTINHTCKVSVPQLARRPIRARILDSVLIVPENIYTRALDTKMPIVITAKPVLKEGQLYMLYITSARQA